MAVTILSLVLIVVYFIVAVFFANLLQVLYGADYGPLHFLAAAGWPVFIWIVLRRMWKERKK